MIVILIIKTITGNTPYWFWVMIMDNHTVFAADNFAGGQYTVKVISMTQLDQAYNIYGAKPVDVFMDSVTLFKYNNHSQFWD